jgi:hypothetical protein
VTCPGSLRDFASYSTTHSINSKSVSASSSGWMEINTLLSQYPNLVKFIYAREPSFMSLPVERKNAIWNAKLQSIVNEQRNTPGRTLIIRKNYPFVYKTTQQPNGDIEVVVKDGTDIEHAMSVFVHDFIFSDKIKICYPDPSSLLEIEKPIMVTCVAHPPVDKDEWEKCDVAEMNL